MLVRRRYASSSDESEYCPKYSKKSLPKKKRCKKRIAVVEYDAGNDDDFQEPIKVPISVHERYRKKQFKTTRTSSSNSRAKKSTRSSRKKQDKYKEPEANEESYEIEESSNSESESKNVEKKKNRCTSVTQEHDSEKEDSSSEQSDIEIQAFDSAPEASKYKNQ